MKLKDIDFKSYSYGRISVTDSVGTTHFPPNTEERMIELIGDRELACEDAVKVGDDGRWLYIMLKD